MYIYRDECSAHSILVFWICPCFELHRTLSSHYLFGLQCAYLRPIVALQYGFSHSIAHVYSAVEVLLRACCGKTLISGRVYAFCLLFHLFSSRMPLFCDNICCPFERFVLIT